MSQSPCWIWNAKYQTNSWQFTFLTLQKSNKIICLTWQAYKRVITGATTNFWIFMYVSVHLCCVYLIKCIKIMHQSSQNSFAYNFICDCDPFYVPSFEDFSVSQHILRNQYILKMKRGNSSSSNDDDDARWWQRNIILFLHLWCMWCRY